MLNKSHPQPQDPPPAGITRVVLPPEDLKALEDMVGRGVDRALRGNQAAHKAIAIEAAKKAASQTIIAVVLLGALVGFFALAGCDDGGGECDDTGASSDPVVYTDDLDDSAKEELCRQAAEVRFELRDCSVDALAVRQVEVCDCRAAFDEPCTSIFDVDSCRDAIGQCLADLGDGEPACSDQRRACLSPLNFCERVPYP